MPNEGSALNSQSPPKASASKYHHIGFQPVNFGETHIQSTSGIYSVPCTMIIAAGAAIVSGTVFTFKELTVE